MNQDTGRRAATPNLAAAAVEGGAGSADDEMRRNRVVRSSNPGGERACLLGDDEDADSDEGLADFGAAASNGQEMRRMLPSQRPAEEDVDKLVGFDTVDWVHDAEKARDHRTTWQQDKQHGGVLAVLDATQSWLVLTLVGMATGFIAGMIDFGVEFVFDLRSGFCRHSMFMSRKICCLEATGDQTCASWVPWGVYFTGEESSFVDYVSFVVFSTSLCLVCATLVRNFAKKSAGSGIPEIKVILGGFDMPLYLRAWTLLIKGLGLTMSVGAGLSVGKEGPLVHVGSCCGELIANRFPKYAKNKAKRREILSAGCAAGVAAAFGAPIGGVLFSLEEASTYFPHKTLWRSFMCATISLLTLRQLNPSHTGKIVLFQVEYHHDWHWFELPLFAALGVMGGVLGSVFIAGNLSWMRMKRGKPNLSGGRYTGLLSDVARWLGKHPILEVGLLGLFTSALSFNFPYLRRSATELLAVLFSECGANELLDSTVDIEFSGLCHHAAVATAPNITAILADSTQMAWYQRHNTHHVVGWLLLTAFAKLMLTIVTFGAAIPAGLFIPSMCCGACIGRALGMMMRAAHEVGVAHGFTVFSACQGVTHCITPGVYGMVGAAAMLSGVTRMTVSLVVIMFELTGGLEYVLPIMVTTIVSKWVGDYLTPDSIYDGHVILNEYPFLDPRMEQGAHLDGHRSQAVVDYVTPLSRLKVFPVDCSLEKLTATLATTNVHGFPVVTSSDPDNMYVVGYVKRSSLQEALERLPTGTAAEPDGAAPPAQRGSKMRCTFAPENHRGSGAGGSFHDLSLSLDRFPISVEDTTKIHRLIDLFRAMGLRYCLATHHGKLAGIINKKDLLRRAGHH